MPHCVIEHSKNLDSELILPLVYSGALNSNLFDPSGIDIKVRAITYDSYLTGKNKSDFIHVTLKILSGRNNEKKQMLSRSVLEQLEKIGLEKCSITIEVVDIDRDSYAKMVT